MNSQLLFRTIVGSQAYGTSLPTSDVDEKFVYVQDPKEILSFGYCEQQQITKDNVGYEVRRMLELLKSANPTLLELLFTPDDCVLDAHPAFSLLTQNRHRFLTKMCRNSFGGYAVAQIKKASALDKKMNWESARIERKTPLDFCYIYEKGISLPLNKWLSLRNLKPERCGLVKLDHIRDGYVLYYDFEQQSGEVTNRNSEKSFDYKGICNEDSNELVLSHVEKSAQPEAFLHWNRDGYSSHCKDYNEYQKWLAARNEQRYVDNKGHNQMVDGKNLMHCRRLLDMAIEIAQTGELTVRRPNRDYLLSIRRGEVNLGEIIQKAEEDILLLDGLYPTSSLPDSVEDGFVNDLLLEVREAVPF